MEITLTQFVQLVEDDIDTILVENESDNFVEYRFIDHVGEDIGGLTFYR